MRFMFFMVESLANHRWNIPGSGVFGIGKILAGAVSHLVA